MGQSQIVVFNNRVATYTIHTQADTVNGQLWYRYPEQVPGSPTGTMQPHCRRHLT